MSSLGSKQLVVPSRTLLRTAEVARRISPSVSALVRPARPNLVRSHKTISLGTRPNQRCITEPEDQEVTDMMMVIWPCGGPDSTEIKISGQATPSEIEWEFGS